MGADGTDHHGLGHGLHHRAAGGKGIGRGTGGGGDNDAVPRDIGQVAAVRGDFQVNDVGDGAFPDDGIVEAQVCVDLAAVPEDGEKRS